MPGMEMTEAEIARNYRSAKYKDRQVGILADLNCASREDITRILIRAGEPVGRGRRRKPNRRRIGKEAEAEHGKGRSAAQATVPADEGVPSTGIPSQDSCTEELFRKLDALDSKIARLEKEYRETAAKIHQLYSAQKEMWKGIL